MLLLIRGPKPSSTHQAPATPARKPKQASRPASPTREQMAEVRKLDSTACRVHKHRLDSTPKQAGPWPLGNMRGMHSWDARDVSYRRPFPKCWEPWITYHIHKNTNSWKNQYCENDYTTQSNQQSQCNPYQITNGISHRTRVKKFTIHMETQKTQNFQNNHEEKEQSWRHIPSKLQTTLQSYSNQNSIVLAHTKI